MDFKELKKLSELARLKASDEELSSLGKDLGTILNYVSLVKEVAGVDISSKGEMYKNVMREDEKPDDPLKFTDTLLREAPLTEKRCIKVKKIL